MSINSNQERLKMLKINKLIALVAMLFSAASFVQAEQWGCFIPVQDGLSGADDTFIVPFEDKSKCEASCSSMCSRISKPINQIALT